MISIILSLTSIITGIRLYSESGSLYYFLFTCCRTFHPYQSLNTGILMNSHLSLSRNVTFQTFDNALCLYTDNCQYQQQSK